jgi:hypothetical protein
VKKVKSWHKVDQDIPVPIITIIVLICGGLLGLTGLVLGIVALFKKNSKKIFAVLAILGSVPVILLLIISFLSLFIFQA